MKPKPQDGSLKISPYTYASGYSCFVLHTGDKPTQSNILFESQHRETVEAVEARLRERFAELARLPE